MHVTWPPVQMADDHICMPPEHPVTTRKGALAAGVSIKQGEEESGRVSGREGVDLGEFTLAGSHLPFLLAL